MYRGMRVSVVIPAYNEESHIEATLASVPELVDDVVVVDDCSADGTRDRIEAVRTARVHVVRHERNGGVGASILTGYRLSVELGADVAAVMAGDGQMDPHELPALLDPIAEGTADYVKGNRLGHPELWQRMPRERILGSYALTWLTRFTSGYRDLNDSQCGYTALARPLLERLESGRIYPRYGFPNDLLAHLRELGARVSECPVTPIYGTEQSGIRVPLAVFSLSYVLLRSYVLRQWRTHVRRGLPALPAAR